MKKLYLISAVILSSLSIQALAFEVSHTITTGSSLSKTKSVQHTTGTVTSTTTANLDLNLDNYGAYAAGCPTGQCGVAIHDAGNWSADGSFSKNITQKTHLNAKVKSDEVTRGTFCNVSSNIGGLTIGGMASSSHTVGNSVAVDKSVTNITGNASTDLDIYDGWNKIGSVSETVTYNQQVATNSKTDTAYTSSSNTHGVFVQ